MKKSRALVCDCLEIISILEQNNQINQLPKEPDLFFQA